MQRIPLAQPAWDEAMREAALKVLDSGRWVKGPENQAFAEEFAHWCGAIAATPCHNGSAALIAALRILSIGPGDEVIVPSLTFIATATAVSLVGATPVFVDVERDYWCIDPSETEAAINKKTKAVIGVHLFGQAFSPRLREICDANNIALIEDAAQAHGTELEGKRAGSIGDIACFSFFPSKNMAVGGEGGMITTTRPDLAEKMLRFVNHGRNDALESVELATNLRMSEVQAAIGRVQLKAIDEWISKRRKNATEINQGTKIRPNSQHSWHQYCILSENPGALINKLSSAEIDCKIYYSTPCHRQAVFANHHQHDTILPVTDEIASRLVAVPVHPGLNQEEVERIVTTLSSAKETN